MPRTKRVLRSAYADALDALTRRGHAEDELRRVLTRRGHEEDSVSEALSRLVSQGLLDDTSFALAFARSRAENGGMGARRIAAELTRRGVDRHVAAAAIAMVFAQESFDETALMERAAARKLRGMTAVPTDVRRRRLLAFLIRRGYGPSQASATANHLVPD